MESRQISITSLKSRMSKLLFKESLSDVTFIVDNPPHQYFCHKLILATGSKVFKAMLYGKMAEKSEIPIPDVTANGFEIMLQYLYTDTVNLQSESDALEVAYVSKKYLLYDLFQACEKYLISHATLNVQTVFSLYEEATFLEMDQLQAQCLRFVSRNASRIFLSPSFIGASKATILDILNLDFMNVSSETEIIEALWTWGSERCKEEEIKCSKENIRIYTKDLLKYVRFLTLGSEELETVLKKFQLLDESEQLAVLFNIAMPSKDNLVKMPSDLSCASQQRSISNSSRLELPTEYRYDGDMTNFSVKKHEQRMDIAATGPGVTIVGIVVAFKPVICYSSLHRKLDIEIFASNETTNVHTSAKLSQSASDQTDDKQLETELLLDDYITFSEGEIGNLTVRVAGEGVRIMECRKENFVCEIRDTVITFSLKANNCDKFLFPIKEIMCVPG